MENLYNDYFFNEFYEKNGGGNYMERDRWYPHFDKIAENIIANFSPKTVLDAGCACGYLVEALRKRGVEAYGIDVSTYAIDNVDPEIKTYCRVHNISDRLPADLPQRYDLIITIEVLEHLYGELGEQAIKNLCQYSDTIVFTSTPDDITDQTHVNVQLSEYWCRIFAQNSFYHNLFFKLDWICPWAMLFEKRGDIQNIINEYERKIRIDRINYNEEKASEISHLQTSLTEKYTIKLDKQEKLIKQLLDKYSSEKQTNDRNIKQLEKVQEERENLNYQVDELTNKYDNEIKALKKQINSQINIIGTLEKQLTYNEQYVVHLTQDFSDQTQKLDNSILLQKNFCELLNDYKQQCINLQEMLEKEKKKSRDNFELYQLIENATWWKITKPFRIVQDKIRNIKKKGINDIAIISDNSEEYTATVSIDKYPAISKKQIVPRHVDTVDIIICVHNAYEDVKACIESVFQYTNEPYKLIIVDDGSADQTRDYLRTLKDDIPSIKLIRNENGNGYTKAANMGLRASNADYCVLLNSDTIVTENWLDKMIYCAKSDASIGIVGPLSNTASWQSVPQIFDEKGDWSHNKIPTDFTINEIGKIVEKTSAQLYKDVPLLNGFCLLIARSTINRNGYLDETTFSQGFGEEDDYNLRAGKIGIKLAIADDTYIFHAQSKSYSDAKRLELCKNSGQKLRKKHGDILVNEAVFQMKESFILQGIRNRIYYAIEKERLIKIAKRNWECKRVLIILPIADAGGGANVLLQESEKMIEMGVDVWIFNLSEFRTFFEASYPNLKVPIIYEDSLEKITDYVNLFDAVCCTLYLSVKYLKPIEGSAYKKIYYIQDFEPYFFNENSYEYKEALESYKGLDKWVAVTKTQWNKKRLSRFLIFVAISLVQVLI